MLRISRWVSIAVLVLEIALLGTVARAQTPGWRNNLRLDWAPAGFYNWTGFYIGINGGGEWSPDRNIVMQKTFAGDPFFDGNFGTRSVQGGFGGGQFGYNWQRNNWVFGVEFDAQGGGINGRSRETVTPFLTAGNSITFHTDECVDFFSTVRGRFGYAWGSGFYAYGTAGLAVVDTDIRIKMMNTFGFDAKATNRELRAGYVVGVGGQYAFNSNWSVGAEFLYIDTGNSTTTTPEFLGPVATAFAVSNTTRLDYEMFRVRLDYKWGGMGLK